MKVATENRSPGQNGGDATSVDGGSSRQTFCNLHGGILSAFARGM